MIELSIEDRLAIFLESGKYSEMKDIEGFLEQSKEHIHTMYRQSEQRRHLFKDIDMLIKFVPVPTYSVDHPKLIDSLEDYLSDTYLSKLLSLDTKKLKKDDLIEDMQPFIVKQKPFLRLALNKHGKSMVSKNDYLFGGQSIEEMLLEYRSMKLHLETISTDYKEMMSDFLRKTSKSQKTKYGTLVYQMSNPSYNMKKVLDVYDMDWVKHYCTVNTGRVKEFIELGIVPKSVLSEAQSLIDINLTFTIMSITSEAAILKSLDRKKNALKRFGISA